MKQRRVYDTATKIEAANSTLSVHELAKKYKTDPNQIYRWRRKYGNKPQVLTENAETGNEIRIEVDSQVISNAIEDLVKSINVEIRRQVRIRLQDMLAQTEDQ